MGAIVQQENSAWVWLKNNRDMCVEALLIYLGLGLIFKGIQFILNRELAQEYASHVHIPFFEFLTMHVVVAVNVAGGLLLTLGLITRVAALIQIPILLGAIFFVHWQQGLFSRSESLEFVILLLFLMIFFVIYGGGRLSVDEVLARRKFPRKTL